MKENNENLEHSEEVADKLTEESSTSVDKETEEVEQPNPQEPLEQPVKKNRHLEAKVLVERAYAVVKEAEEQMEACKLLLSDDLKEYNEAKEALNDGGLKRSEALLKEIGVTSDKENLVEDSLLFEPKEELEPMVVKDVSSGRFTGFLMALLGGLITFAILVYVASMGTGITLDITKIPSDETVKTLLTWLGGGACGSSGDVWLGVGVVFLAVLAVMWIIYALRIYTKGKQNLRFALQQLEDAEAYSAQKSNCKEEMDRIDAHINESINILKIYRVLLNEQNGKLERILYLEGKKEDGSYHPKSLIEIKDTQKLIDHIHSLMAVSMSDEGRLSKRSVMLLQRAQEEKEEFIKRFY